MTGPRPRAVLVAEDDPLIMALIRASLQPLPVTVVEAATGPAVLTLAQTARPDLVLLDVGLPQLDGFEVCRRLKADPVTRTLPVVLLTARAQQADRDRGAACGADDFVVKPFSPAKLLTEVRRWLG